MLTCIALPATVKVFFSNASAFCAYIKPSPERKAQLNSHCIDILNPGETRWYHKSHAISAIFNSYDTLVTAFMEITEILRAGQKRQLLRQMVYIATLNTCFLSELYYKILEKSTILY